MGLPISDTAMAIFRRWVRNLPLSAADRRHVHHLLMQLGLNPRQAALMLYCFSGFLCGAVMLGVALRNEYLTLVLGISGCLVFLLIVTSRRDELTSLRGDLQDRMKRKRQEREAAKLAWEAVQRVELCMTAHAAYEIVGQTARALGCSLIQFTYNGNDITRSHPFHQSSDESEAAITLSGPSAVFRLSSGQECWLTVSLTLPSDSSPAADIVFRYLQRLSSVLADRLNWLQSSTSPTDLRAEGNQRRSRQESLFLSAPKARG
jgi:UDP-GlcNAc:undecaprenyl-phosphate GlcNAc-1-phosphate transferase